MAATVRSPAVSIDSSKSQYAGGVFIADQLSR
jgi:hypothetical protein